MAPRLRPYRFYDAATSICARCYRRADAKIVFRALDRYLAAVARFSPGRLASISRAHLLGADVVVCECALCTFPDRARALAEMRRVLVPRGRVAISDVLLEAPVPRELDGVLGHVLCIASALDEAGYRAALEDAGFSCVRARDASDGLQRMLADVEARIGSARRLAAAGALELPHGLEAPEPVLAAARRFIAAGGLRYGLIVARR